VVAALSVALGGAITLGICLGPLLVGYLRIIDRQARGEAVELHQVLDGMASFAPAFLTWFLLTAAFVIGSALVLPGVVVAFVWAYALWFVALRNLAPTEALRASFRLARAHVGPVLLLLLAAAALNFLGAVVVVGVLVTLPLALILLTLGFAALAG